MLKQFMRLWQVFLVPATLAGIVVLQAMLPGLQASTLVVQQRITNDNRQLRYTFDSAAGQLNWQFVLANEAIRHNSTLLRPWMPANINEQLGATLQQQAYQAGPFVVEPGPAGDWQNFQLTGPDNDQRQQMRNTLLDLTKQFQQQKLAANGYQQVILADNTAQIRVDHLNVIQQSIQDVSPIAESAIDQLGATSQRQLIQLLLTWVQQIPADPVEHAEYGQSYRPPLRVLTEHQADSASKAVLLAAILRSCLPQLKQALLYTPGHTLLAIAIAPEPGDLTVTLQDTQYLPLDPAAQQQPLLGQVAQQHQLYIVNQYFAYRQF